MNENAEADEIRTILIWSSVATVLLVFGFWGGGIRPALFDLTGLSGRPTAAGATAVIGFTVGIASQVVHPNPLDDGKTFVVVFAAIFAIGVIAVEVVGYAGSYNPYMILAFICALYGMAAAALYNRY